MLLVLVTALWIAFDVAISVRMSRVTGPITKSEARGWVALGVVLALIYLAAGYGDYTSMTLLTSQVSQTQKQLRDTQAQLKNACDELTKGQAYNTGQLDVLGKIGAKELELLANKTNVSPNAGANVVASAAVSRIDELSKQVAARQAHTMAPVIPANVEAQIESSLRAAGPHPVSVNTLAGNKNAVDYSNEWVKIFKAAGWMKPNDASGFFMPFGSVPIGLSFQAKGPHIPEGLQILVRILKDENIEYDGRVSPVSNMADENAFVLVVGANP